jgi:very-short-patch-repair endonuclease
MPTRVTTQAIKRARRLRRNMTEGERKLWSELKQFRGWYGVHVRKQTSIGDYTVDFVIHEHRLIVEVDGEHHFTPDGLARDARRDAWLESLGYRILRFNTGEISNSFNGCVEEILAALGLMSLPPTPYPSPQVGGGF